MNKPNKVTNEIATAALVLSREHLVDEFAARNVVSRLEDGAGLIDLATRMFSLPMVAKHLNYLQPNWFEPQMTKHIEIQFILAHQMLRAEQKAFYERCIAPVGCGHAFIKGFALADQFYDRPSIRFARDIDVLVRRHALPEIVNCARMVGYEVLDSVNPTKTLEEERDVRAALRYQQVVNLISPTGRSIEVHREVDKNQGIFDERQMLFGAETITIGDGTFETLNPIDHFIYVSYHCARHNWSKLHWLADLAAMERSSSVPHAPLLKRAKEMGLEKLVEETLGFVALSANPEAAGPDARGRRILDRVLDILVSKERRATEFANTQITTALPFPDMLAPWLRNKVKIKRFYGRLKPQISDYQSWPLPDRWQWLYRVSGPTRRILQRNQV